MPRDPAGQRPMCHEFRPSREEFSRPFCDYVREVCRRWPDIAMFKVIPPKGWTPRKEDCPNLQNIRITNPIKQHVIGSSGAFRCFFEENKSITAADYKKLANTRNHVPPPKGHRQDDMLERAFWSSVTLMAPMYGADTPVSLFDEKLDFGWNLHDLQDFLQEYEVPVIPGVTTPMTYFGMWKSFFSWHVEDVDLYSVNYLHFGAPKVWYCVSPKDRPRFEAMAKSMFPELYNCCPAFMRHKDIMFSPKLLRSYGVDYVQARQGAGEFVVLNAGAYHSGFNLGFNCAEAVNFATCDWLATGRQATRCTCSALPDSVRLDMGMFAHGPKRRSPHNKKEQAAESSSSSDDSDGSDQEAGSAAESSAEEGKEGGGGSDGNSSDRSSGSELEETVLMKPVKPRGRVCKVPLAVTKPKVPAAAPASYKRGRVGSKTNAAASKRQAVEDSAGGKGGARPGRRPGQAAATKPSSETTVQLPGNLSPRQARLAKREKAAAQAAMARQTEHVHAASMEGLESTGIMQHAEEAAAEADADDEAEDEDVREAAADLPAASDSDRDLLTRETALQQLTEMAEASKAKQSSVTRLRSSASRNPSSQATATVCMPIDSPLPALTPKLASATTTSPMTRSANAGTFASIDQQPSNPASIRQASAHTPSASVHQSNTSAASQQTSHITEAAAAKSAQQGPLQTSTSPRQSPRSPQSPSTRSRPVCADSGPPQQENEIAEQPGAGGFMSPTASPHKRSPRSQRQSQDKDGRGFGKVAFDWPEEAPLSAPSPSPCKPKKHVQVITIDDSDEADEPEENLWPSVQPMPGQAAKRASPSKPLPKVTQHIDLLPDQKPMALVGEDDYTRRKYFHLVQRLPGHSPGRNGKVRVRLLHEGPDSVFRPTGEEFEEAVSALIPLRTSLVPAHGHLPGGFDLKTLRSKILRTELL